MNIPTNISRRAVLFSGTALVSSLALSACDGVGQRKIIAGQFVTIEMESYAKPNAAPVYTAPKGKFDVKPFTFDGRRRQYHAYRSRGVATAPTSVLLMLHGAKRTGASMVDMWRAMADTHNILLVAPDSHPGDTWDPNIDTPAFVQATIDHAKNEYGVGDVPVYGFGHSAGAILMTLLSFRGEGLFKRVAVHAGYLNAETADRSRAYTFDKPPLAHFLGQNDHIFNVADAEACAGKLATYGQDVRLYVLRDHTHWYYDIAPFINNHAWKFLTDTG